MFGRGGAWRRAGIPAGNTANGKTPLLNRAQFTLSSAGGFKCVEMLEWRSDKYMGAGGKAVLSMCLLWDVVQDGVNMGRGSFFRLWKI